MQEPLLISSSEAESKPRIEKLKYFYKASTFARLFFSWIYVLIDVISHIYLVWKQKLTEAGEPGRPEDGGQGRTSL